MTLPHHAAASRRESCFIRFGYWLARFLAPCPLPRTQTREAPRIIRPGELLWYRIFKITAPLPSTTGHPCQKPPVASVRQRPEEGWRFRPVTGVVLPKPPHRPLRRPQQGAEPSGDRPGTAPPGQAPLGEIGPSSVCTRRLHRAEPGSPGQFPPC